MRENTWGKILLKCIGSRNAWLLVLAVTLSTVCARPFAQSTSTGSAQAYPTKPVCMIAPFPPGGSSDLIARILAQNKGTAQSVTDLMAGQIERMAKVIRETGIKAE